MTEGEDRLEKEAEVFAKLISQSRGGTGTGIPKHPVIQHSETTQLSRGFGNAPSDVREDPGDGEDEVAPTEAG